MIIENVERPDEMVAGCQKVLRVGKSLHPRLDVRYNWNSIQPSYRTNVTYVKLNRAWAG